VVSGALREFFLLDRTEREVAALTASQRAIMLAYAEAAKRRISGAPSVADPRTAVVAAMVLRDGVEHARHRRRESERDERRERAAAPLRA
jgi:hypothetical protein